jgi:hypothetical protein
MASKETDARGLDPLLAATRQSTAHDHDPLLSTCLSLNSSAVCPNDTAVQTPLEHVAGS